MGAAALVEAAGAPPGDDVSHEVAPEAGYSRSIALSWGLGGMAASASLAALSTQFLFFMTDYVGMAPAIAGTILAVAKASDVLSDIAVGLVSDRVDTRWGRRRPWVLAGALMVAATLALIFNLNNVPENMRIYSCVAAMLVFYLGYTCLHIPLVAMSADIASGYKSAGRLWGYGMFFSMLGNNGIGTSFAALLVLWFGQNAGAYNGMSFVISGIVLAAGIICVIGTRRVPRTSSDHARKIKAPPVRVWISSLVGNRAMISYVVSETVCYFAQSMLAVTMTYYLFNVVRLGQMGMLTYGMAGLVGSVVGMVVVLRLMKWIPKHVLSAISAIGTGCVVLSLGLLDDRSGLVTFGTIVFVWGTVNLARSLMANALVPDLIHADFLITGMRREGAIASITSAIQKTTPAVATGVFSFLLASSGYISGQPGGHQPQSAIDMIVLMNCVIPGVLLILSSLVLLVFYNLSEQRLRQLGETAQHR
jgi:GPH family glycoside/pentoside/hexuronide:cation symporter